MHRYLVDVDVDAVAFRRNDFGDFAAVAGQNRRDLVGADVTRLGHVDDQVGHAERHDRQHDQRGQRHVEPAADPLPVDLLHGRQAPGRPAGWSAATGGGRRGGPGGGGGFGGGVPSSAALTASIGSRSGGVSSRTAGMTAVRRSSGGAAGRRGGAGGSASADGRSPTPSAARPARTSLADRLWRPSLFTGRPRAIARGP